MRKLNWLDVPERIRQNNMPFCGALLDYYVEKFRNRADTRRERLAKITTRRAAEEYIADVRKRIKSYFNFPTERCELQAKTIYRREEADHNIEGVIYFSRPGLAVSALFMTPKTSGKHPGVLFLCGHSASGKLGYYQTIASDLARQGFAVLIIDPIGQGERKEELLINGEYTMLSATHEHNLLGRRLGLAGERFAAWRTYDAVRGLDYLTSRSEVDTSIIGVTGCSGGCTLTTYVMAVDDRPTMAAASCAVTTWEHNVENEHPVDLEQMPQGLGSEGLELADLLIAAAPKPYLILTQSNDFFDPRGTGEVQAEMDKFYKLLGKSENTELFYGIGSHYYSMEHRFAMQKFFGKYADLPVIEFEKLDKNPLPPEELYCSDNKLVDHPGSVRHDELAAQYCRQAVAERVELNEDALRLTLKKFLALPETSAPYFRNLRPSWHAKPDWFGRTALETEPNRVMSVLKYRSSHITPMYQPPENKRVMLYIGHLDSEFELIRHTPEFDGEVCPLDVRGIGELTPGDCLQTDDRDFFNLYESDYHYAALGDLLGEPLLGGRVHDILCAARLLEERNCSVELYGKGQGGIAALFAAFIGKYAVTLEDVPASYLELAENYDNTLPQALLPFDILRICDLNELIKYTNAKIINQ